MRDVIDKLIAWSATGQGVALATVVQTWGSAPRPVGANMAVNAAGEMTGSVSGGCVEGAVVEAALDVLQSGKARLLHFGVADETAWAVGLSCGGNIQVFVRPASLNVIEAWQQAQRDGKSIASLVLIDGPDELLGQELVLLEGGHAQGSLGPDLDPWGLDAAQRALAAGAPARVRDETRGAELFINVELPLPTLIVVGGVHITIPLVSLAKTLEYRTIVVDPRRMFASEERFPNVDQLLQNWPDKALIEAGINASTAVAALTHDPKIDDPALKVALNSPAFYIGALGSRKTQAKRQQRLLEAGLTEAQLARIHAPIGLDLGGRSPEEIALAIMAEIVQARYR